MSKIFTNPNQIEEWVEASQEIQESFGIDKALGYVIGEKFYNLVSILHACRAMMRAIEEARKNPDYNPIREIAYGNRKYVENLDETYDAEKGKSIEAEELLIEFTILIKHAFEPYEIRQYFESHPRLGVLGHTASEEQHDFMVIKGAIEHSLDTEIEDALILGEMLKYFGVG